MCLTEIHINPNVQESEIYINGWQALRSDRVNRQGAGILVYIKDSQMMFVT